MSDFDTVSNAASAARFAINPTPLGAAGLGLGIASSMLGGKGKKKKTFIPGFRDGQYINRVTGKPWEAANSMVIQGDKGTYDLIPQIGAAEADYGSQWQKAQRDISGSTGSPNVDKILYHSMRGSLGDDAAALAEFDKRYPLRTGGMTAVNQSPQVVSWLAGVDPRYSPDYKYSGIFSSRNPTANLLGNSITSVRDTIGGDLSSFGTFARDNNISRNKRQQLSNALLNVVPQYQAPNVQYQAPRG